MDAYYTFYVKSIETHVRTFLPLNISAINSVLYISDLIDCMDNIVKIRQEFVNLTKTEQFSGGYLARVLLVL